MTDKQKRQLYWALKSLASFVASRQFMLDNDHGMMETPLRTFLVNAQYSQLHDYYYRGRNLRQLLGLLGCGDLLADVDAVLRTPIGGKTFAWLLNRYRVDYLAHASYNPDDVWDWAPQERRLEFAQRMSDLMLDLGQDTAQLHNRLTKRYPNAEQYGPWVNRARNAKGDRSD